MAISADRLREILDYNLDTGVFTYKVKRKPRHKIGDIAGTVKSNGYIGICIDRKLYLGHRLAWLYVYGYMPNSDIDHIDHNQSNNRIANLRIANRRENMRNASLSKASTSGCCGVSRRKDNCKWRAHIKVDGKQISLGSYETKGEAVLARKTAEKKLGFHANHGSPR